MALDEALRQITRTAEQIVAPLGLVLLDVKLSQSGKRRSVVVTICRRHERVGFDDLERVSRQLESELDSQPPAFLSGPYLLEVESPGIDRVLKTDRDFEVFSGHEVAVEFKEKIEGLGVACLATLKGLEGGRLNLTNVRPSPGSKGKKAAASHKHLDEVQVDLVRVSKVKLNPNLPQGSRSSP